MDEPSPKRIKLPQFTDITLRQLFWICELNNGRVQSEIADMYSNVAQSTVSRDFSKLEEFLKVGSLASSGKGSSNRDDVIERISRSAKPLMELLEKLGEEDSGRVVRIGAGGSIISWLIGSRVDKIRDLCRNIPGSDTKASDVRLLCTPMENRSVLKGVRSGVLDLGIVRSSLLSGWKQTREWKDGKASKNKEAQYLEDIEIGTQIYSLVIPKQIYDKYKLRIEEQGGLNFDLQKAMLTNEFVATVAAEGEFKVRLEAAMEDCDMSLRAEFSYRSFPQILPHILEGTHIGIAPLVSIWKNKVPKDVVFEPLLLLSEYNRKISLIYSEKLCPPWLKSQIQAISNELILAMDQRPNSGDL